MLLVIDFIFDTLFDLWSLIRTNWLLSLFTIILILGWVVNLINASRNQ